MGSKSLSRQTMVALFAGTAFIVSACTTNVSPNSYQAGAVGEVRRVERGEIESFRWVELRTERGVGTAVGVGAGAVAGSTVGDGAGGVLGAIGGAIIGGAIGHAVDKGAGRKGGFEYVIRLENGALVTIVQADKSPIPQGAPVLISYSRGLSRVRLDESRIEYQTQGSTGG